MDFDELERRWREQDRNAERALRLGTIVLEHSALGRIEQSMRRLSNGLIVNTLLNAVAVLFCGSFAADHVGDVRLFVPAAVLGVYFIGILVAEIRQIAALRGTDYDEPVIAVQRRLTQVRAERARAVQWLLASAPLMWVPLLIVLPAAIGIDVYAALGGAYLMANLLLGLAVLAVGILASKRFGGPFWDRLSGRSLSAALDSLEALRRFEEEPG
jgi:Zn-dependent protease with chaperone function